MKEFIIKHPIITLIAISLICGTIVDCAKVYVNGEVTKSNNCEGINKGD